MIGELWVKKLFPDFCLQQGRPVQNGAGEGKNTGSQTLPGDLMSCFYVCAFPLSPSCPACSFLNKFSPLLSGSYCVHVKHAESLYTLWPSQGRSAKWKTGYGKGVMTSLAETPCSNRVQYESQRSFCMKEGVGGREQSTQGCWRTWSNTVAVRVICHMFK